MDKTVNGFDVARAEKMLRQVQRFLLRHLMKLNQVKNSIPAQKSLEWRRVNKVDTIFERYTPSEVIQKYFSFGQIGVDKFGCPGNP